MRGYPRPGLSWVFLGAATIAAALFGPVHAWAERSFAAHMLQHMILMDAAAPLLAFGLGERIPLARTSVAAAAGLHGLVLWGWHVPAVFGAAVDDAVVHPAMHASFLAAGLLFWRAALRPAGGAAVFWMFMTVMHSGLLGALITFAPQPVYAIAGAPVELADQQAAGLLMWVGGTAVYTLAGIALAAVWLRRLEERA